MLQVSTTSVREVFFSLKNLHSEKHSPLLLGVWVTDGRNLEVQCKFMGQHFVRLCSEEFDLFLKIVSKK